MKGLLTLWCAEVVSQIEMGQPRSIEDGELNSIEDLTVDLLSGRPRAVVVSCFPDAAVVNAVRRVAAKYVLSDEAPSRSAHFRAQQLGDTYLNAIRGVLAEVASLHGLHSSPDALRIDPDEVMTDPIGQIRRIAAHFDRQHVDAGRIHERSLGALEAMRGAYRASTELSRAPVPDMSPEERSAAVIAAALGRLRTFDGQGPSRLLLASEFILASTEAGGLVPLNGPMDATGRARLLAQGPHIFLAADVWRARCVHRFTPDLGGHPFTIDAVSWSDGVAAELAKVSFTVPPAGGLVETTLNMQVTKPQHIIEVRLFADRAIFSGEVTLGYVEIVNGDSADPFPS